MYLPLVQRRTETEVPEDPPPVTIHVVAPGETLWTIARSYGTSVEALKESNQGVDPTRLRIGQQLIIP